LEAPLKVVGFGVGGGHVWFEPMKNYRALVGVTNRFLGLKYPRIHTWQGLGCSFEVGGIWGRRRACLV
jgi:hypothetical protein